MNKKKLNLAIEVDTENGFICVKTSDGEEIILQSLALFGGDAQANKAFIKMYGASADSAWSFAQGFKISRGEKAGKGIKNFFKQAVAHICHIIDPNQFRREVGGAEMVNKWESTDQTKWGGWDSEDVLIDKAKSEAKKKKWTH